MKVNFITLSYGVSLDQRSNMMSIINVMEGLRVPSFPAVYQNLVLVVALRRKKDGPKKGKVELTITGPLPTLKKELPIDFDKNVFEKPGIMKEERACKLFINIPRLELKGEGDISFVIKHDNKKIGEYEITIIKSSPITNLLSSTS